ncbi:hypothetical protein [Niallia sp. RD1]|uniref:hypothetical protein n=1 Tax=Niallia sp. RD1 TaxID=2962858 RepID=UPI0020C1AF4F|nr:hypothetical protein [Niallia sp. RD1]UTI42126.1 hypothetical protein NKG37_25495 [Niallia sp. RD1]
MLLEPIKMLLDYSHKNQLDTSYQEIGGEIIKAYKINDKTALYLNGDEAFLSEMKYINELDLYYSTGLLVNLGKVGNFETEKEIIIKLYEKLTTVSLLEYFTSNAYDRLIDENITELLKQ